MALVDRLEAKRIWRQTMPTTLYQLSPESGLNRYLSKIRRLPILEPKEEYLLGKRWRELKIGTPRTNSSIRTCDSSPR
jgi:hypothetical protein